MPCSDSEAAHLARMLISGYPNSQVSDPEYYIAQIVTIFTQYELDLVRKAVAPSGIPYDIKPYMPTVGEVEGWLRKRADKAAAAREHQLMIENQLAETDAWIKLDPSDSLKAKAKEWLNRTAPQAEEMALKPKVLTEEQKKAALESAAKVGKEISGMKLLPETIEALRQKEAPQCESSSPDSCTPSE